MHQRGNNRERLGYHYPMVTPLVFDYVAVIRFYGVVLEHGYDQQRTDDGLVATPTTGDRLHGLVVITQPFVGHPTDEHERNQHTEHECANDKEPNRQLIHLIAQNAVHGSRTSVLRYEIPVVKSPASKRRESRVPRMHIPRAESRRAFVPYQYG